jgi:hypothetical protein
VIQVDRPSYDKLIQAGGLFIGYDYCYTFDAVEVLRCYNCNGYHHTSKSCKNKKSCPRCGGAEKLDNIITLKVNLILYDVKIQKRLSPQTSKF